MTTTPALSARQAQDLLKAARRLYLLLNPTVNKNERARLAALIEAAWPIVHPPSDEPVGLRNSRGDVD